jgi:hypothetical protein
MRAPRVDLELTRCPPSVPRVENSVRVLPLPPLHPIQHPLSVALVGGVTVRRGGQVARLALIAVTILHPGHPVEGVERFRLVADPAALHPADVTRGVISGSCT